ncbi:hypothetical protein ACIBHY_29350 [Nonomuraea sp. NPDC050547]|uniref:hypothetical protein n=1 Tax=Nonomuraea sp. NPDC050547 TaxID=3364368 RepID=UPI0037972707
MTTRRWVLVGTAVLVAVLAILFAVLGWDTANRLASLLSALAGVAAVGVAVWAALPAGTGVRVSRTGRATAGNGGSANTGLTGRTQAGPVRVDKTGDADGGDANTGVRLG